TLRQPKQRVQSTCFIGLAYSLKSRILNSIKQNNLAFNILHDTKQKVNSIFFLYILFVLTKKAIYNVFWSQMFGHSIFAMGRKEWKNSTCMFYSLKRKC